MEIAYSDTFFYELRTQQVDVSQTIRPKLYWIFLTKKKEELRFSVQSNFRILLND